MENKMENKAVATKVDIASHSLAMHAWYRWVALVTLFMGYTIAYAQRLSMGPLAPFMKAELGLTNAQVGYFTSAALTGYTIFLIPSGLMTDKFGVRWTLFLGQVIAGICLLGMLFAQSATMGMVVMFAAGIGLGFLVPSTTKGVVEWFPLKERGMAMGIKQMSVNVGGMLSAALLPIIALSFGWRWGFATIGFIAIISGIICFALYKAPPKDETVNPAAVLSAGTEISTPPKKMESWRVVFKSRDIYCIIGAGVALVIAEYGVLTYFVLYLKTFLLIPVVMAGFMLGTIDFGGLFGKPLMGAISDRFFGGTRKIPFIILGFISTFFTRVFALLPVGTSNWIIIACAFCFGFAAVGWGGLYHTMIAECAGKANAATVVAAAMIFIMIAGIIGTPLFGYLSDKFSWATAWTFVVIMGFIGTVGLFFVREEKRRLST